MALKETEVIPNFVIITGLSGSGMSSATNAFEDLGYFCVDNLPISMLATFARLLVPTDEEVAAIEKAALVIDIRERHFLSDFPKELKKLNTNGHAPFVLFFEADDDVLERRFSETRRPHPADKGGGKLEGIRAEKKAMKPVREIADMIVNTSDLTVHTLRRMLVQKFGQLEEGVPLNVQIISFGHKHGSPRGVDLLFDVRHLPNPYFETNLKELPGTNKKVLKFLNKQPAVIETIKRFSDLLKYLLPQYHQEGKSYLSIGIGCTGGRHRSVMVSESLSKELADAGFNVSVIHRDIKK